MSASGGGHVFVLMKDKSKVKELTELMERHCRE